MTIHLKMPEPVSQRSLQNQKLSALDPPELSAEVMQNLWEILSALYGNRWSQQQGDYGGRTSELWAEQLASVTPAGLAYAIQRTAREAEPLAAVGQPIWPPGLMEIYSLAAQYERDRLERLAWATKEPRRSESSSDTQRKERAAQATRAILAKIRVVDADPEPGGNDEPTA